MIGTKSVNKNKKSRRRRRRARLNYRRVFGVALVMAVIVGCMIWISRCGDTGRYEVAAEQRVVERGYTDAMKAVQAPEGSMEREKCILSIRAFESKLRQNGYAREADDYHDAAEKVLKGQGIIK